MNRYYVYIYLDQRISGIWKFKDKIFYNQPFYIGKGTSYREICHLFDSFLSRKSFKSSKIKAIISNTGEMPLHFKVYDNLSQTDAILIEKEMIKYFGRIDNKTGILTNHTDGGEGANNFSKETKSKMGVSKRKVIYQYSLDGKFIKKWDSLTDVQNGLGILIGNISTAVKNNGTAYGFIWSYSFKGDTIKPKKRWQSPIKYQNIKQVDPKTKQIVAIFNNALEIEKSFNLVEGGRNQIYTAIRNKTISNNFLWQI